MLDLNNIPLPHKTKSFLNELFSKVKFSQSESRIIVDMALDLIMWNQPEIEHLWAETTININQNDTLFRKKSFNGLRENFNKLKLKLNTYTKETKHLKKDINKKPIGTKVSEKTIAGFCPVASDKTVCCNLRTIDAIVNCSMGCSYCAIQTMFNKDDIAIEENLSERLNQIKLDKNRYYHYGTGQSSDSLFLGNRKNVLDDMMDFCRNNTNIFLEFKTKSSNIKYFKEKCLSSRDNLPRNFFISWSLNPDEITLNEEIYSATLEKRLKAARNIADLGIKIGFHFHPIVLFENWQKKYTAIVNKILTDFKPQEIIFISLGTLTFPKPVAKKIRYAQFSSQILKMPFVQNPEGKLTYPDEIKYQLFSTVYDAFENWHNKVFFYLCMEEAKFWKSTFNNVYNSNDEFEEKMLDMMKSKIV